MVVAFPARNQRRNGRVAMICTGDAFEGAGTEWSAGGAINGFIVYTIDVTVGRGEL